MKKVDLVTTEEVLKKIKEVQEMLAKLREQAGAGDGEGADDFQKNSPKESDLEKAEKDYARAADVVREHNRAGSQEGAAGLAASQEFMKVASLRERARKEAQGNR